MKKEEKKQFLIENYPEEWKNAIIKATCKADDETPIVCCCGRLATGLHTKNCSKFKNKIESFAINELKHLIK